METLKLGIGDTIAFSEASCEIIPQIGDNLTKIGNIELLAIARYAMVLQNKS